MTQASHEADRLLAAIQSEESPNTANLRRLRQAASKRLRNADASTVLAVAKTLIDNDRRWLGYELIHHHPATLASLGLAEVEALGTGMASWSEVDTFCAYVAGPCWAKGQIDDHVVLDWSARNDRWWRRAALVATTALNVRSRGGTGDPHRTLMIAEQLLADRDDMVVKALSWALRELIYWDPTAVADFLEHHDQALAPRVKREVRNKLETGLKNPKG